MVWRIRLQNPALPTCLTLVDYGFKFMNELQNFIPSIIYLVNSGWRKAFKLIPSSVLVNVATQYRKRQMFSDGIIQFRFDANSKTRIQFPVTSFLIFQKFKNICLTNKFLKCFLKNVIF